MPPKEETYNRFYYQTGTLKTLISWRFFLSLKISNYCLPVCVGLNTPCGYTAVCPQVTGVPPNRPELCLVFLITFVTNTQRPWCAGDWLPQHHTLLCSAWFSSFKCRPTVTTMSKLSRSLMWRPICERKQLSSFVSGDRRHPPTVFSLRQSGHRHDLVSISSSVIKRCWSGQHMLVREFWPSPFITDCAKTIMKLSTGTPFVMFCKLGMDINEQSDWGCKHCWVICQIFSPLISISNKISNNSHNPVHKDVWFTVI